MYIKAAVGLACVAIVVVGLWLAAGYAGSHKSATSGDTVETATVTSTASCQGNDTQDSVTVKADGTPPRPAKLDGCGHQRGETMQVLVPADFDADTALVPTDSAPGDYSGLDQRVAFVLLIVAMVVAGAFAYRFVKTRGQQPPARASRPADRSDSGRGSRLDSRIDSRLDDDRPEPDYPSDIGPVTQEHDPDETGVDWFVDSETDLSPVQPPADVSRRADRS